MAASATAITAVAFIQRSGSAIIICIGLVIRRDDLVAGPCESPYDEIGHAAIASHERMYEVAAGKAEPFTAPLEYLPKLFL